MWTWTLLDESGVIAEPPAGLAAASGGADLEFSSQSDAETWIGETWRELSEAGVSAVTLNHDGGIVYGPMSLSAPDS
ncbi:MAG: hypothetical protein WCI74_02085 [Actinomycetes bacterium]